MPSYAQYENSPLTVKGYSKGRTMDELITSVAMFCPWTECAPWLSSSTMQCWSFVDPHPPAGTCQWMLQGIGMVAGPSSASLGPWVVGCSGNHGSYILVEGPATGPWTLGCCAQAWHWSAERSATGPGAESWPLVPRWCAWVAGWKRAPESRGASCCLRPSSPAASIWLCDSGTTPMWRTMSGLVPQTGPQHFWGKQECKTRISKPEKELMSSLILWPLYTHNHNKI